MHACSVVMALMQFMLLSQGMEPTTNFSPVLKLFLFLIISCIHSGHFYSTSSSPLLLRSAPDTARILCQSFMPKRHRQLRVKDLPKVPTWRWEPATLRSKGFNSTNAPQHPTISHWPSNIWINNSTSRGDWLPHLGFAFLCDFVCIKIS